MSYQTTRNVRRDSRTLVGRTRAGRLSPVLALAIKGNEGGMVSQSITCELDPIPGRMITPITAELISVFAPVQALDALKNPDGDYAGLTEVVREKLLSGNPLFGLEAESEISKRCGVNPRSIGGQKKVSEAIRLAHNAAVNHLRLNKYVYATKLDANNTAITPALIAQTVLDRFNAVLDPDDRVNGMVQLDIPDMKLPVTGIGSQNNAVAVSGSVRTVKGDDSTWEYSTDKTSTSQNPIVKMTAGGAGGYPDVHAELNGAVAGGVSLTDFYNAQTMDRLTRTMRKIVDDNPQYGEEMLLRWAHGLSVDSGKTCIVLAHQTKQFGRAIASALDTGGVEDNIMRSDLVQMLNFTVPVPRTELGGVIITFVVIRPDETISSQPDPFLSEPWGVENFVADELALDPVPVTIRELDSDCLQAEESTVSMYTGLNQLKSLYIHYGLNRHLNPLDVEERTVVWQLEIPLSVTPDTILYPENLPHTPFADMLAEVCTYVVTSNVVLQTPMIIGPTPVENLAVIGEADIFEQGDDE